MYNNRQEVIEAFKKGIFPYIDRFCVEKESEESKESQESEESE